MLPKITPRSDDQRRAQLERNLIRQEAEIGGELFGPVPKGHHRQFFCLDEHTWVWHEEWRDQKGNPKAVTTRYEVRPSGILKAQDGHAYQNLTRDEARNLYNATKIYRQRVTAYYQRKLRMA